MKKVFLILILFTTQYSCKVSHHPEVTIFLDQYYKAIEQEKYDEVLSYYSESFFNVNSTKIIWSNELDKIQDKFGKFINYKVIKYTEKKSLKNNVIKVELIVNYDSITFKENMLIEPENKKLFIKTHHIDRFDF